MYKLYAVSHDLFHLFIEIDAYNTGWYGNEASRLRFVRIVVVCVFFFVISETINRG